MLDQHQIQRYARQLVLKEWGAKAQEKLLASSVLQVGAGGLGSPVAIYLAAAGVGNLTIVDGDAVELSNLNRQIIHSTCDIGRPKTESAKEKLVALNPDCKVTALAIRLTPDNALDHFRAADIVIDCADGFTSKYLLNDAAVFSGKPLVHAGVLAFSGQVMMIRPGKTACLRDCVFPEPPPSSMAPTSAVVGILGAVAASIGLVQATEAIKYIAGIGKPLTDRMLSFDALAMRWQEIQAHRSAKCPICGENPSITELKETIPSCEAS